MADSRPRKPVVASYPHLAVALVLFCFAGWFAVTRHAQFDIGGDENSNRRAIHVNAHGLDAVMMGAAFAGLGLLSVAQGVRGPARLRFFWVGVAALGTAVLYGLVNAVRAVIGLLG